MPTKLAFMMTQALIQSKVEKSGASFSFHPSNEGSPHNEDYTLHQECYQMDPQ